MCEHEWTVGGSVYNIIILFPFAFAVACCCFNSLFPIFSSNSMEKQPFHYGNLFNMNNNKKIVIHKANINIIDTNEALAFTKWFFSRQFIYISFSNG